MKKGKLMTVISIIFLLTMFFSIVSFASAPEIKILSVKATAEQEDQGNVANNLIDGNLETRWAANMQDLQVGDVNFIADLGQRKMISGIALSQFRGDQRTLEFEIHVSKDGKSFKKVFEGKTSGTTIDLQRFDFDPVEGRYVKFIPVKVTVVSDGSTNTWASLFEFKVYGTDVETAAASSDSTATSATATAPNPKTGDAGVIMYSMIAITGICGAFLASKKRK